MSDVDHASRAARNQSLFRSVNEEIRGINEAFAIRDEDLTVACECADPTCVETVSISPSDHAAVRANPRRFVVLPGHVYPDVEEVVGETGAFAVVEKTGHGGDVAERLEPRDSSA